jgi:NAD(P)-dependent dehydrogenase (short-subunit alcohol dehydrogenase family)
VEIAELDVSDEGAVEAFFARAVEKFGRVDFLASVAGYAHPAQPVTILPEKAYQTSFNVNLRGVRVHLSVGDKLTKTSFIPGLFYVNARLCG